jgi:ribosomal protein S18 acetylase RimI-like enzyme
MKNENGKLIGVLIGYTMHEEVYVDDLWVDENYRGNGYGKELMESVEEKFKNKGYNNINLYTKEFQAPYFYKKLGYELEFIRENKNNPKLNKYFFIKRF